MKTVKIEDLNVAEELNRKAMTAVRGGTLYSPFPNLDITKTGAMGSVQQLISQAQTTNSNIGNDLAFLSGTITATILPIQSASNSSNISGH